eukprot:GHVS01008397.1.p1 GENE.GHVS01008397.1~~GHVS01008397.1.p1  ORF type:complete len:521 (-),score=112.23 GHVS01008397.1:79-1641(-)
MVCASRKMKPCDVLSSPPSPPPMSPVACSNIGWWGEWGGCLVSDEWLLADVVAETKAGDSRGGEVILRAAYWPTRLVTTTTSAGVVGVRTPEGGGGGCVRTAPSRQDYSSSGVEEYLCYRDITAGDVNASVDVLCDQLNLPRSHLLTREKASILCAMCFYEDDIQMCYSIIKAKLPSHILCSRQTRSALVAIYITCLYKLELPHELLCLTRALADISEHQPTAFYALGCHYLLCGELDKAIKAFEQCSEVSEETLGAAFVFGLLAIGRAFQVAGFPAQAERAYKVARTHHQGDPRICFLQSQLATGEAKEALLHEALAMKPVEPCVLNGFGLIATAQQNFSLAVKYLKEALSIGLSKMSAIHPAYLSNLAHAMLRLAIQQQTKGCGGDEEMCDEFDEQREEDTPKSITTAPTKSITTAPTKSITTAPTKSITTAPTAVVEECLVYLHTAQQIAPAQLDITQSIGIALAALGRYEEALCYLVACLEHSGGPWSATVVHSLAAAILDQHPECNQPRQTNNTK